jgi:excisionase family DNA binding protein
MGNQSTSTTRPGEHDLLTVVQAAAYLQLSTSSIRGYIRQGKLKAFRIAGLRKVLIPRAELLTLLEPTNYGDAKTPAPKLG